MKKHLSISKLRAFLTCPLKYFFRYKQGIEVRPTSSLTMGRCVHKAIEEYYRKRMKDGKATDVDIKDMFDHAWENLVWDTDFKKDEQPGELKDEGIRLVEKYAEEIAPNVRPKEIEKSFELKFENVPFSLVGVVDLITEDKIIVDHKCSKRSPSQADIDRDIQLSAYQLGYKSLYGEDPNGLRFDYVVRNKQPKTLQCQTERSQRDLDRFLKLLGYVSLAIQADIYYPNEGMLCSTCGYRDLCRKW